ncbi:MAG: glycosyltransferase [bacterium]
MRVAHICTKFNRISETFIYDLVLGLEKAGIENHVLAADRVNEKERPFPRVRILPPALWQKAAFAINKECLGVYKFPFPRQATRHALREIRPDILLAHFGGAGAAIVPLARELGIPLVVVFHAFDLFMRQFRPETYRPLWQSGAQAVVVSEHGKKRLLELGCPPERVRIIHCGLDADRFPLTIRTQSGSNEFRLVGIGRLVKKKGFDDLLRALVLMRGRLKQSIRVDIWGEGPEKRGLVNLARSLGVGDVVTFKGTADHRDIPRLLRGYDAFVLPSRTARNGDTEGIPITILEAQAACLPVVATHHAGIPEAIPPSNRDWLAREGDPGDLADKLLSLASRSDQWDNIGRRGRQWIRRHFSLEFEVNAILRLLRDCAAIPATPSKREG